MQVLNEEADKAALLFIETEGADINPAAAVAVASLIKRVEANHIEPEATIMLNITGGGELRYKGENEIFYLHPSHVFPLQPNKNDVIAKVEALFL